MWFHLYEVPQTVKFIETESRIEVNRGWGESEWGVSVERLHRLSLGGWKVLEMDSYDDCTILWMYLMSLDYMTKMAILLCMFYHNKKEYFYKKSIGRIYYPMFLSHLKIDRVVDSISLLFVSWKKILIFYFFPFVPHHTDTKWYHCFKTRVKSESHSVMSNSLQPCRLHSPWNSPGQNTGVGSCSLLQGTCSTQGSNWGLPHCRWILYQLSHKESPRILEWVAYPFSSRSSRPRNWTRVSCISGEFFTNWPLKEALKTRERLLKATLERENSFWTSLFKMKLKVRCSIWTVGHQ